MHAAVGLPAPIILPRPCWPPEKLGELTKGAEGVSIERTGDLAHPVGLGIRGVTTRLRPAIAREVAAALAAAADEADCDPDLAIAADLAEVIRVYGAEQQGRLAARAILTRYQLKERAS